jgi:1,4-dihydroxy-2-naphthoate octaprenyltransferase
MNENNQQELKKRSPIVNLFRLSRPLALLVGIFLYGLGGGVANYLGNTINWTTFFIGLTCVLFIQLSSYYLKAYYDAPQPEENDDPIENKPNSPTGRSRGQLPRVMVLQSALITMTAGAALTVLLLASGSIQLPSFIFLGFALAIAFFYAVPPVRLVYTGYGELANAILMADLVPSLAFLFQTGDVHRVLAMLTFPLTALYLAASLALGLRHYGADMRYGRQTLMVRMTWQRGMNLHNILILVGYLMFVSAALLGLPWSIIWPVLLTFPIGLFEIWQINQIARGGKPRWNLLALTAAGMIGLVIYFLNFVLWLQ